MSRSLMFDLFLARALFSVIAAVSIISCQAMQKNEEKLFVCESEIDDIQGRTKRITDEYITDSGARYYRKHVQESYCVQLANGDKLSTTRINKGQGDTFRSIRFDKADDESLVDLSENSFRVVQGAYLKRQAIWYRNKEKNRTR